MVSSFFASVALFTRPGRSIFLNGLLLQRWRACIQAHQLLRTSTTSNQRVHDHSHASARILLGWSSATTLLSIHVSHARIERRLKDAGFVSKRRKIIRLSRGGRGMRFLQQIKSDSSANRNGCTSDNARLKAWS